MTLEAMLSIVRELGAAGVRAWVDGGWGVDALLGRQTRPHADLDIAVDRSDLPALRAWSDAAAFVAREGCPPENPVLERGDLRIDVHAFQYDAHGAVSWGIAYPFGSLTGRGKLGGVELDCVCAEWMFKFKTSYAPRERDRADVRALAAAFGFPVPDGY